MITKEQWQSLIHLKPSDFKYPNHLNWTLVKNLDLFIGLVGSKPIILDDYREGDAKQHGYGNAVDTTFIGVDPLFINQKAFESKLWRGIGLYFNDIGAASHHFDVRPDRSPENPAKWGGIITHPFDSSKNQPVKKIEYMSIDYVIDSIKKKESVVIIFLIISALLIWKYHE